MPDFTSALYLGLRHPSWSLAPWRQLTSGRPAALDTTPSQAAIADALATLVGCARATLGSSTLHLFWDLSGILDRRHAIFMDAGAYPIARWGVERAAARRIPVHVFLHYDVSALRRALDGSGSGGARPVVISDGFCPGCGKTAPVSAYLEMIRQRGGLLVLDDTQALGLLGHAPSAKLPLGIGGGGSLRFHDVSHPNVLLISSLAKAFGAPLAMLAGSHRMVRSFEASSETRVHTSPPSLAVVRAAQRALAINRNHGDRLRQHLARLVGRFRARLAQIGMEAFGASFPMQTLGGVTGVDAEILHRRLLRSGVRTVLHRARAAGNAKVSFLITARHTLDEIDRAVNTLEHALSIGTGEPLENTVSS